VGLYRRRLDPTATESGDPIARELDEEIESHLAMRAEELIARGMSPEEADAEARRRFGQSWRTRRRLLTGARRRQRRRRLRHLTDGLAADVRLAVRHARRSPGFTTVALLIFAGGVGLTTSIFTVADHVLLRALPFPDAHELVALWSRAERGNEFPWVSMGNWVDWKEGTSVLEATALYRGRQASIATGGEALYAQAVEVAGPFFRTLGHPFLLGRPFTEAEAQAGEALAVVSEGFWRRVLGADPALSERPLAVNGRRRQIVGVVPTGESFPSGNEIWLAASYRPESGTLRNNINYEVIARLADGVAIPQARADLDAVAAQIRTTDPEALYSWGVGVRPLREVVVADASAQLRLLAAAVGFLLLVACANLAGLSLARGKRRALETAVHLALGSGRGRVARRVVSEHVLLALAGGAIGVLLAWLGTGALLDLAASVVPRAEEVAFDLRVAAFGVGASLAAGLLAGVAPALGGSRGDLSTVLSGARGEVSGGRGLPGAFMVGAEIALAVTLLVAGGLLLRSFWTLVDRDLGFEPGELLTADLALVGSDYRESERSIAYWDAVYERVAALPGVDAVAVSNAVPTSDGGRGFIDLDGRVGENIGADYRVVGEGYFDALGIPLLAGRAFDTTTDGRGTERVTVVSQGMAERFWPNTSPLGHRVRARSMERYVLDGGEAPWLTVVGVVGDVRQYGFESDWQDDMYVLHRQVPYYTRGMTLVVKARPGAVGVADAVRAALRAIDPAVVVEIASMDARLARLTEDRRLVLTGLGLFGGAALVLVGLGIYGLMSFAAGARTREMAIRVALGAEGGSIVRLMLGSALRVVLAGAGAGLALSYLFTHLLESLLVDVGVADPVTYATAIGFLVVVAVGAAAAPSLRAASGDPLEGLRG
jgi:putative ABC transport system permease protein